MAAVRALSISPSSGDNPCRDNDNQCDNTEPSCDTCHVTFVTCHVEITLVSPPSNETILPLLIGDQLENLIPDKNPSS